VAKWPKLKAASLAAAAIIIERPQAPNPVLQLSRAVVAHRVLAEILLAKAHPPGVHAIRPGDRKWSDAISAAAIEQGSAEREEHGLLGRQTELNEVADPLPAGKATIGFSTVGRTSICIAMVHGKALKDAGDQHTGRRLCDPAATTAKLYP